MLVWAFNKLNYSLNKSTCRVQTSAKAADCTIFVKLAISQSGKNSVKMLNLKNFCDPVYHQN